MSSQVSGSNELLLWAVLLLQTAMKSSLRHFHINGVLLSKECLPHFHIQTSHDHMHGEHNLKAQWKKNQRSRRQSSRKCMKKLKKLHIWLSMKGEIELATGWDYCNQWKRWTRNGQKVSFNNQASCFHLAQRHCASSTHFLYVQHLSASGSVFCCGRLICCLFTCGYQGSHKYIFKVRKTSNPVSVQLRSCRKSVLHYSSGDRETMTTVF